MNYREPRNPHIEDLSTAVKDAIQCFDNACNLKLDFDNELFESKIKLVKQWRVDFHSVAMEMVSHSDALIGFGEMLIIFFEFRCDEFISNEDLSEFLHALLEKAKSNREILVNTNEQIYTLADKVVQLLHELIDLDSIDLSSKDLEGTISAAAIALGPVRFLFGGPFAAVGERKRKASIEKILGERKGQMDDKLEISSKRGTRPSKIIVKSFIDIWKVIIEDCEKYAYSL